MTKNPLECRLCGQVKTVDEMVKSTSNKLGFRSRCKVCDAAESQKRRDLNKARRTAAEPSRVRETGRPPDVPSDRKGVKRENPDRNHMAITVTDDTAIRTIEDLLGVLGMPLAVMDPEGDTEWYLERFVDNTWSVHAVINQEFQRANNWQVKAWFVRRVPLQVKLPELRSINIRVPRIRAPRLPKRDLELALLVPDSQHGYHRDPRSGALDPYHDRKAWDIVVQVARVHQPDRIILLGDHLDFPEMSDKFLKTPSMHATIQPALCELGYDIGRLRAACPNAQIDYLEGNHEFRMQRKLFTYMMEAADLRPISEINSDSPPALSVRRLLELDKIGVKYHGPYPGGEVWLNENLRISHGEKAAGKSGLTAKQVIDDAGHSEIFGHVHRIELICRTAHRHDGPVSRLACSPGTLARIDGAVPARSLRMNWQTGFGMVEYEPGNGYFRVEIISINDAVALYRGKRYEGAFDVQALRRGTGWEHF